MKTKLLLLLMTVMLMASCNGAEITIADNLSRAVYISSDNAYSIGFSGINDKRLSYTISDLSGSEVASGRYEIKHVINDRPTIKDIWIVTLLNSDNQFSVDDETLRLPDVIVIGDIRYNLMSIL